VTEGIAPVLLTYDGSPGSATAIAVAGQLLLGRDAVVCHAWSGTSQAVFRTPPSGLPGVLADAAMQLDECDRAAAEEVAAEGVALARSAGFDAEPFALRRETKTWRAILRAADETDASIVVAGAHGFSGVGRAILGSVSTGLVHHSAIPVLVVPGTATEESLSGPPLFCYDGSHASKRAIERAAELLSARRVLVGHFWDSWVAEAPALAGASGTVRGMATELMTSRTTNPANTWRRAWRSPRRPASKRPAFRNARLDQRGARSSRRPPSTAARRSSSARAG
jgi:nucleotide-binding universal stress UspA family protein